MKRLTPQPGLVLTPGGYTLNGHPLPWRVTTFCEEHFWQKFDREAKAAEKAERDGGNAATIAHEWAQAGVIGSEFHVFPALYFDTRRPLEEAELYARQFGPTSPVTRAIRQFKAFWAERTRAKEMPRAVALEYLMGCAAWGLAGTLDAALIEAGEDCYVWDWKTYKWDPARCWPDRETGELPTLRGPFADWEDTKVNRVAIQIGLYRALLLRVHGLETAGGRLLWVPTNGLPCQAYELPDTLPALLEFLDTLSAPAVPALAA